VTLDTIAHPSALTSPVRTVDHVPTYVPDPDRLFEFLSGALGLPVAWAMGGNEHFRSGAVFVGNCSIEAVRYMRSSLAPKPGTPPMFQAVAFETHDFEAALEALDARGFGHFDVPPSTSIHGADRWTWRTSLMREPSSLPDPLFFLCDVEADNDAYRHDRAASVERADGGLLGVERLAEIVVGAPDPGQAAAVWERIFAPRQSRSGTAGGASWELGGGVQFTVEAGPKGIRCLRLAVQSLAAASAALRGRGLRAEVAGDEVRLSPDDAFGLDIRLLGPR
jgi:catechol 2,3-dioxygenase-like lactoylglutathione lyase family enzyme